MQNPLLDLTNRELIILHNLLKALSTNGWPLDDELGIESLLKLSPDWDASENLTYETLIENFCKKLSSKLAPFVDNFLSCIPVSTSPIVFPSSGSSITLTPWNMVNAARQQQENQTHNDTQG